MPGKRKFTKGGKGKAKKKKKKGAKDWSYYDDFGQDDKAIAAAKKEQNKIKYGDIGFSKPVESTAVESSSSDEFYDSDSDVDTAYDILVASAKQDAAANSTVYSRLLKQQSLEEEGKSEDSEDSEEEEEANYIHEREEEQYDNDLDQED